MSDFIQKYYISYNDYYDNNSEHILIIEYIGINKETVTLLDTHETKNKIELEMTSTTIISNDNQMSISVKKEIMFTIMGK